MFKSRLLAALLCPLLLFAHQAAAQSMPNHNLLFGYWYIDGTKYGNHRADVWPYTNLYVATPCSSYISDPCNSPDFQADLDAVKVEKPGVPIYLVLQGTNADFTQTFNILNSKGMWPQVVAIEIHHEATDTEPTIDVIEGKTTNIRTLVNNLGLSQKPLGILLDRGRALTATGVYARNLDVVSAPM